VARGEDTGAGLAAELAWAFAASGRRAPLDVATRLDRVVRRSDVVVSATSAAQPLFGPDDFAPGSIVCDVAKPADVCRTVHERRPDVLVFDGGLVRYPDPIAFAQNMGYEPGVNLACLTETVILALEGVRSGRFGVGLASELVAEVPRIRDAARRHGFTVGELRAQGRVLGAADFDRVRSTVERSARPVAA
jgi:predicted amino acid dehydrogenase